MKKEFTETTNFLKEEIAILKARINPREGEPQKKLTDMETVEAFQEVRKKTAGENVENEQNHRYITNIIRPTRETSLRIATCNINSAWERRHELGEFAERSELDIIDQDQLLTPPDLQVIEVTGIQVRLQNNGTIRLFLGYMRSLNAAPVDADLDALMSENE